MGQKQTLGTCLSDVGFAPESGHKSMPPLMSAHSQKQTSSQELGSLMGLGAEVLGDTVENRLAVARIYRQRVGYITQAIGLTFCQLAVSHAY